MSTNKCFDCENELVEGKYGETRDETPAGWKEIKLCHTCCGAREKASLIKFGSGVLYYKLPVREATLSGGGRRSIVTPGKLTNWFGSFDLPAGKVQKTILCAPSGTRYPRYDIWFVGPDGKKWHGACIGNFTELARCNRLKEKGVSNVAP